jgi:quercetin dioxygenase-like cupin family protein
METTTQTDAIWFIENLGWIRVSGDETNGRLAIVDLSGRRGHMPPLHVHHAEDESFVVLDGEVTLYVGAETRTLRAGETALGPKGIPHTFRIESETARWLAVCAPAGFDRFVAEVGEPAQEHVIPETPVMPDPAAFEAICGAHGIEVLGPPGTLPS